MNGKKKIVQTNKENLDLVFFSVISLSKVKTTKLNKDWVFHPLCNFTVMKGYKSVALTRAFVNSLIEKRSLLAYRLWLNSHMSHNNEHYFSTMALLETERDANGSWILRQRLDLQQ